MVLFLSDYFRYILHDSMDMVSLSEEIEHIRTLADIRSRIRGCRIEFKTGRAPYRGCEPSDCRNPSLPLLRMVTPEDVGELTWFLCSPGASAMTGDAIRMDKGLVLS